MYQAFKLFIARMKAEFRAIARATKNEVEVEDLHSDAWILAQEIGTHRGRGIDFSDPADKKLLMSAVNLQNVRRGDWNMRRAVRTGAEEDDDGPTLMERMPAQSSSDPLVSLLKQESALASEEKLASSYSQATAYVMTFVHFKHHREDICAYLVISKKVLSNRVSAAANIVTFQSSLFDRIERIDASFRPLPGRHYITVVEGDAESIQASLPLLDILGESTPRFL